MLDLKEIQTIRGTLRSVLEQCNVPYKVTPYDHDLHRECIEEAVRRGYPVEGGLSLCTFLRVGVTYALAAAVHLSRPTQIWIALYTSCVIYVDEIPARFPSDICNFYLFPNRFIEKQQQENAILDALADIIRRAPDLFSPIPSKLIMTSTLNFFTANLLEHETKSMEIASAVQQYPIYQRTMTALAEGYAYFAFPPEIPLTKYVQAIPEDNAIHQ
ncbi:hypothetical protein JVT61DRAFT_655 [Boletus reticuloceps]|uniref:Uncharacterized protein n=1 Tax=Boletus reticuloceps TaxID=495285 RepID=A0A8I3AFW2_9AGAM|nr:hypothetical protein JVT61DRAFT_655 [Boletus reticuloceps]